MKKKLTLQDFSDYIVQHEGVDKATADSFVRAFFDAIEEGLLEDKFVKIKGFGTFKLVSVSERESVNINTGERFQISGHTKVSFTPDNAMKELVNRPFAHFEAVDLNDDTDTREFEVIDEEMETDEDLQGTDDENEVENEPQTDEVETESHTLAHDAEGVENEVDAPFGDSLQEPAENHAEEEISVTDTEVVVPQPKDDVEDADTPNEEFVLQGGNQPTDVQHFTPTIVLDEVEAAEVRAVTSDAQPSSVDEAQSGAEVTTTQNRTSAQDVSSQQNAAHTDEATDAQHEKTDEDIVVTNPQPINHQSVSADGIGNTSNTLGFTYNEVPMPRKRNWWKIIALTMGIAILMVASYFVGYYRILCPTCNDMFVEQPQPAPVVSPQPQPVPQPAATSQPVVPDSAQKSATPTTTEPATQSSQPVTKDEQPTMPQTKAPETKEPKVQEAQRPTVHRVQPGDNISRIAKKYYGSDKFAEKIIRHNNLKDANTIKVGMELKLP